jgi:hypothetical protein
MCRLLGCEEVRPGEAIGVSIDHDRDPASSRGPGAPRTERVLGGDVPSSRPLDGGGLAFAWQG